MKKRWRDERSRKWSWEVMRGYLMAELRKDPDAHLKAALAAAEAEGDGPTVVVCKLAITRDGPALDAMVERIVGEAIRNMKTLGRKETMRLISAAIERRKRN